MRYTYILATLILSLLLLQSTHATENPTPTPEVGEADELVFNDVHSCDMVAGHPDDPQRFDEVDDEYLIPNKAIAICNQAIDDYPDTPRFYFQIGRALWKAQRYDEAVAAFKVAITMNYDPAAKYLGDAYREGLGLPRGETVDKKLAEKLYKRAMKAGFSPATLALWELTQGPIIKDTDKAVVFDASKFQDSRTMENLYEGNFEALNKRAVYSLYYVEGMFNRLVDLANPFIDASCVSMVRRSMHQYGVGIARIGALINNAKNLGELAVTLMTSELIQDKALKDTIILVEKYGCESHVAKRIVDNSNKFISRINKKLMKGGSKLLQ